jgi:hypothetical protein
MPVALEEIATLDMVKYLGLNKDEEYTEAYKNMMEEYGTSDLAEIQAI